MNKTIYEIIDYDSTLKTPDAIIDSAVLKLNIELNETGGSVFVKTVDADGNIIKHNLNYDLEHSSLIKKADEALNRVEAKVRSHIVYKVVEYEKEEDDLEE